MPCFQQLFDILVALGVAAAGDIGVRQLVDQDEAGSPLERSVDVELAQDAIDVDRWLARQDLEALEQRLGFLAAMRLDDADDDIHALFQLGAGRLQHLVGLADPRRSTHEDLELADAPPFPPGRLEQRVRRGSLLEVASLIRHRSHARRPASRTGRGFIAQ